jgi:hypothetical protein
VLLKIERLVTSLSIGCRESEWLTDAGSASLEAVSKAISLVSGDNESIERQSVRTNEGFDRGVEGRKPC